MLRPETLRQLLQQLETTNVDELEITCESFRLFLRREPGRRTALRAEDRAAPPGVPIVAPLTGIYYSRASPEQPVYVAPGSVVAPGDVVALIETMKLFNEVIADVGGTVMSVVVTDGDLVEAGQPLLYVSSEAGQQ